MQTGVTRDAYKQMMHRSPNFRAMVEDAMADAIDLIEYRGVQRAIGGSDRMIEFFLRAHRPDLYDKGQKVDLTLMVREMAEREGIDPDEAEAEAARLLKGGA